MATVFIGFMPVVTLAGNISLICLPFPIPHQSLFS
jgi:hypothetical protein